MARFLLFPITSPCAGSSGSGSVTTFWLFVRTPLRNSNEGKLVRVDHYFSYDSTCFFQIINNYDRCRCFVGMVVE